MQRDARIVTEAAHNAVPGVQPFVGARLRIQRQMIPVVPSHRMAELAVCIRASELLNPWMLVRRDELAGQLAADAGGLFRKQHRLAQAAGGQRRGASSHAAADDDEIGFPFKLSLCHLTSSLVS